MPKKEQYWSKNYQEYLRKNREEIRRYNTEYLKDYRSKEENKTKRRQYQKKQNISIYEWRKRNPHKLKAQEKLQRAVKAGKVPKSPCQVCLNPKSEGHHPDYSKPLEVIWLCHAHHRAIHYGN